MTSDNLDPLVTQCPNCDTRFRVTESQLQAAGGRVRCGACLSVFDGASFLIIDGESIDAAEDADIDALLEELDEPVSEAPPPTEVVELDVARVSDPGILADTELDDLVEVSVEEALHGAEEPDPALVDLAQTNTDPTALDQADTEDFSSPDELDQLEAELLADLRGESTRSYADVDIETLDLDETDALTEAATEPPTEPPTEPSTEAPGEAIVGGQDAVDATGPQVPQPVSEQALAQEQTDGQSVPEPKTAAEIARAQAQDAPFSASAAADAEEAAEPATAKLGDDADLHPTEKSQAESESNASGAGQIAGDKVLVPNLIEEDLALDLAREENADRGVSWARLLLIVLCVVGIPAQILWFQFDVWSKDADLRPLYVQICSVLGCELPQRADVSSIVAENAVLRPHPEVPDALIYDALLINQATFAQPFPLLELTLTSIRGHLVAGRRFAPDEYVTGELLRTNLMPPRTPIHISLEIKDPGQAPLNFRIRFLLDNQAE